MRITDLDTIKVNIPWSEEYSSSLGTISGMSHLIVKIHTDAGITGIGEVSSLPEFSGETLESMEKIVKLYLRPALIGEDPLNLEKITERMNKAVRNNNAAKASIDFALHDIMGKHFNNPLYKLIGGLYQKRIPISWSIGISRPEDLPELATKAVREGYEVLNLKIGINPEEDVERVRIVRETVGDKIEIRVDANQAYTPEVAIRTIRRMERYGLQYVEQPVPGWDLRGMARVARSVSTPLSADESLFSLSDALKIIESDAASILAIKVAKVGGIYNSKKIAAISEAAGVPCMVGSNFELGVGVAAGVHFAASTGIVKYHSELTGPLRHRTDIIKDRLEYQDGFLEVPKGPGLGVELSQNALETYQHLSNSSR